MDITNKYALDKDELEALGKYGGYEVEVSSLQVDNEAPQTVHDPADVAALLSKLAIEKDMDEFEDFLTKCWPIVLKDAAESELVASALMLALRLGITQGSGLCANNLGALYYLGEVVEQDYAKAAELYELAMKLGSYQSIINLGYIYEYGRLGECDYLKAYECYSLAAAFTKSSEALYKMGDIFSRGKLFGKDMAKAYQLWEKSYHVAEGPEEESQPAIRIAKLILDPACEEYGAHFDPLRALALYQTAEVGLRISIDSGLSYYRKRLEEAIEGQQSARALLDVTFDM